MKTENETRPTADSDEIDEVLLTDGCWYPVEGKSFRLYSPVEANLRVQGGQRPGTYLLFKCADTGRWIEAPLGSLVAWSYAGPPEEGVELTSQTKQMNETDGDVGVRNEEPDRS